MNGFRHIQYLKKLKRIIFLDRRLIVVLAVIKLITMLLSLFPPYVYQYYINHVISDRNIDCMSYVIIGYIALFFLQSFVISLGKYLETKYTTLLRVDIKKQVFNSYSKMPYSVFELGDIGEKRLRAEDDVETVCNFYLEHCLNFIFAIIYAVCVIVIIFCLNAYLTVFGCIMIMLSFFITKVLAAKIIDVSKKYRTDLSEFDTIMHDAFKNWKEIKINNIEDVETDLLSEKWSQLSQAKIRRSKYNFFHGALVAFNLFFVTRMNLYFFGGLLVIYELMTVPTILIFMNYYEQLYANIQTLFSSMVNLGAQIPQIDKVLYTLSMSNKALDIDESIELDDLIGDIEVRNLKFKYPSAENKTLEDVTLRICKNKTYALIGKSGSGKTTLVKLLVGLYSPIEGDILVKNVNLRRVPDNVKCHYINIVMQDPQFFNMSILDNLLLAKVDATEEEIDWVCKAANIYDFIQETPDKYDTYIGENGIKLSGGQKQRLAIARTMLLNPKILIFDEATSALDTENEEMIMNTIDNLSLYMTVIVISHRFSSIIHCDEAIVIKNGKIMDQGPMSQIINKNNTLHELFNERSIST